MTDLFQDRQQRAGEDLYAIPAIDEAVGNVPALLAGSSAPPTTESPDARETPESLQRATNDTTASPGDNVESGPVGNVVGADAEVNEVCPSGTKPQSPTKLESEIGALHTQIKGMIAGRTRLPDNVSALIAFWALSTWFLEALTVFPLLVISGPAHEAVVVLGVLKELCWSSTLLAGFRRADLKQVRGYHSLLISEAYLDNRTAALLGNLTNRHFILIEQGDVLHCAGSRAVYIGEHPAIKRIQHSLYIDVTSPSHVAPPIPGQSRQETIDSLRNRLLKYRNGNLDQVCSLGFHPRGLSPEAHTIANALGSCVVDAPQLQMELVRLLRPQLEQQIADRSNSVEALVASAALALCHQGMDQVYVKEITAEVNRLLVARGETMQLSPEKVGHNLKKVGLFTRRLSQAGNGLIVDQATRSLVHEVVRAYVGEDCKSDTKNLHCPLCSPNERLGEDM